MWIYKKNCNNKMQKNGHFLRSERSEVASRTERSFFLPLMKMCDFWRNFPKFKVLDKIPNPHTSVNPMDTNRNRRFTTPPDPYFETKTALKVLPKLQTYLCEGLLYVYGFNCTFMVDQFQLYL